VDARLTCVPRRDALPAQWTQDKRLLRLLATAGFIFAAIRLSILGALANAGPDITAAITPVTPVATLVIALVTRVETLDVRSWPGAAQLSGLLLCSLSSVLMGVVRGPLLFGTPPQGEHAPTHVARGVAWMLVNTLLSAVVQIVNKQTLAIFPTISMTAAVAAFAVLFLIRASCCALFHAFRPCLTRDYAAAALFIAPSPAAWVPDGVMLGACLYTGLMATGVNNVLLSRVNRRLGPTAANLYMPLQPLTTAFIDWMTLGDAFYVANLVCGIGITAGLVLAVGGRQRAAAVAASEQGRQRAEELAGLLDADALQLGERTARSNVAAV
jgi:drug/metabolite transporter (DMT)-like permease